MRIVVAAVGTALFGSNASADSWTLPTGTTATSGTGYQLTVTPGSKTDAVKIRLERSAKRVYERAGVNHVAPVRVLVSDDGHVVTLGDWGTFGYALAHYHPVR